jgi:hypothetical protein
LQASGNSTLQQITAVVSNDGGAQKINFISNLSNFSISVASGTGGEGISVPSSTGALDSQNAKVSSTQVGAGGSVDISTQAGAEAAVAAIGNAVQALGTAQAAVGKGQLADHQHFCRRVGHHGCQRGAGSGQPLQGPGLEPGRCGGHGSGQFRSSGGFESPEGLT